MPGLNFIAEIQMWVFADGNHQINDWVYELANEFDDQRDTGPNTFDTGASNWNEYTDLFGVRPPAVVAVGVTTHLITREEKTYLIRSFQSPQSKSSLREFYRNVLAFEVSNDGKFGSPTSPFIILPWGGEEGGGVFGKYDWIPEFPAFLSPGINLNPAVWSILVILSGYQTIKSKKRKVVWGSITGLMAVNFLMATKEKEKAEKHKLLNETINK